MARVRPVESGFFPLDEELGLLPGSLTPHQQESLVRLAVHMPFAQACAMLGAITGVQISEASTRRQTYAAGMALDTVQEAQAELVHTQKPCRCEGCQPPPVSKRKGKKAARVEQMVLSSDGVLVPLVGGIWVEVKTMVIGEVETNEQSGEKQVGKLSYFSRLSDAQTFGERVVVETKRRGLRHAQKVAAVQDGAEWLQDLVDEQRGDAVRILDFAHAAGYLSDIATLVRAAGTPLPPEWLTERLHTLKDEGPSTVLAEVQRLHEQHPQVEELGKKVAYLQKREAHMQYPSYQQQGWPIGSGMVESANKHVVQARLKGAGMHWASCHVNPMLALRCAERNHRWEEASEQSTAHRRFQHRQRRHERHEQHYQQRLRTVQTTVLLWRVRTRTRKLNPPSIPLLPGRSPRPAPDHPWRRRFLAKK